MYHQAPVLRGIKHMIAEAGRESRHPFTGAVEVRLLLASQGNAAMLHREQFRIENACLGAVEWLRRG